MDNEQSQNNSHKLESDFRTNNAGPLEHVHLSVRPARFYARSFSRCARGLENRTRSADGGYKGCVREDAWTKTAEDADAFERGHAADVQLSRNVSPNAASSIPPVVPS